MGSDSKQPAARLGDIDTGHPPAPPTPIITGSTNVLINGRPAARQNDMLAAHHPGVRLITEGSPSVLINGRPAARVTDSINCGGKIIIGSSDVLIGNQAGGVRNVVTAAELNEYIRESLKPKNAGLSPKEETQLAADIAVKYRGREGAVATWHDYFMGNEPEAEDARDPTKAAGLRLAEEEKSSLAGASESVSIGKLRDVYSSPADAPMSVDASLLQPRFEALWGASFPGGRSMEHGGTLVRDKDEMAWLVNEGAGTSGSFMPSLDVAKEQSVLGVFHTHPYDASEVGFTGVSLSGGDAGYMINNKQAAIIAQSGEQQFMYLRTLKTPSSVDASALNTAQNTRMIELIEAGSDFGAASKVAAMETAKNYGLAYYEGSKGVLSRVFP